MSIEILVLRVDEAGRWRYRRLVTALRDGETPDAAVRRQAGVDAGSEVTVVHSTSWRYEPRGRLVLTYAVCPDPDPDEPAEAPAELRIARGAVPAGPTPEHLRLENVVAHALWHLARLLDTDPVVAAALGATPAITHGLRGLPAPILVPSA
ncbi:hypothetical protein [Sphaerisporangium rufum]|uniref:hypothetical protein n=1 Tax=Sphaerisporangium rufum TaxID=1381558 RepID=UPI001952255A|nr:hypothetical protein [Sphaerisporangium rufum]